jgi:hypothetical protein
MAGSYNHAVNEQGQLRNWHTMAQIATENQGDSYETIHEMYGMIWFLAEGDRDRVDAARTRYLSGIEMSPGIEHEDVTLEDD